MMRIKERQDDFVSIEASGTLERKDYEQIVPQLEKMVEDHGKIRALIQLNDFHGWKPSALIDELRFDVRHRTDVSRCAILGENEIQKAGTKLTAPLFQGDVKFFSKGEIQQAKTWLSAA